MKFFIPLFFLSLLLSGCNSQKSPPVEKLAPVATPKPRPTPRPAPTPHTKKPARIFYGVQTKRRVFALTFDDGPDPAWTPKVLAILRERHVPATFFMVGTMVRAHPASAKEVRSARHSIGNHSWSHPREPREPRREIERTDAIIGRVLGVKPTLFRPPYGIMNNGLVKIALSRGENAILWNCHGADWDKRASAQTIAAKVLKSARRGGIALLHDGGGNRAATVAALPRIIETLRQRGYRFVTLSELMTIGKPLHFSPLAPPKPKKPAQHRKPANHPKRATQARPKSAAKTRSRDNQATPYSAPRSAPQIPHPVPRPTPKPRQIRARVAN